MKYAILALASLTLALTGCGTPAGIATANFLESPENKAIVDIGVQAGVGALFASQGNSIPEEMRAPLQSAAVAAGSGLSTGLIYAAAEALRTKQATASDVSTPDLTSAAVTQADIPPQVAKPIAAAVTALNAQGVPADAANEAVAKTLDAVAAAQKP